jgi:lysophospholipase
MLADAVTQPMETAPFFADVAEGPDGARAYWVRSADGTRLRMGVWPEGAKGTVLMLPGRTEYIEKYGRVAGDLAAAGYGMVAFDWRGQGLSDRPQHRRDMGHVVSFDEYREDMAAFRAAMTELGLTGPFHLLAHSMGGAIGLRALYDGIDVASAVFTGPMWGIQMAPFLRSISSIVLRMAGPLGFDKAFAMTTGPYAPMAFEDNELTTDRAQFEYMERQTRAHPDLTLGGPSNRWVRAALTETAALVAEPPLPMPILTLLGTRERIVEVAAIEARMANWPGGVLKMIDGAEHEVLMESPNRRAQCFAALLDWFDTHG